MPTFPRYQSKGSLTTQAPSVQAPADTSGEIIQKVGQLGQAVQETTLKVSNAFDSMQKTQASVNFKTSVAEAQQKFQLIPNPTTDDLNNAYAEIEKARSKNLQGFSTKTAETETALNFGLESKVAQIQLENHYKKKVVENDQVNTKRLIDFEINNPTPDSFGKIKKIINDKQSIGIYGAKEAEKLYKDSVKTIGEYAVASDPADQEGKSEVLEELRKGDKGKFASIPPDERLSLIKTAQQRIFNNNQTYKRDTQDASNERSNNLIEKIASGEATIQDVQNEMAVPEESGGIKRTQLLTYQRGLVAGVKGDLNRMLQEKTPDRDPTKRAKAVKDYLDLIDNFIDDNTDQWKAKEMLATAWEDGNVSPKEASLLNGLKQNLKDIEFNRNTNPIVSAIKGIKDFFGFQSNSTDEDLARNMKTLLGDIQSGTDPGTAMRKTIQQDILSRIPDYRTYPETGKLKRDAHGNVIRVYPDGTYEEELQKKGAK